MPNLKQSALQIFRGTLAAIDVPLSMQRKLARTGSQIFVNGIRSTSPHSIEFAPSPLGRLLPPWPTASPNHSLQISARRNCGFSQMRLPASLKDFFQLSQGTYPVPDKGSFEAGRAILDLLAESTQRTLVFFLLSGGGSALVELPLNVTPGAIENQHAPIVTLEDMQALNRVLVTCGASIDEINAIRKHLSAVKGGRLAVAAGSANEDHSRRNRCA